MAAPLRASALLLLASWFARGTAGDWTHGWDSLAAANWGYGAMGGGAVFDDADVAYAASTYRVIVLSICMGANTSSVAATVSSVAARLKALSPGLKVLQYFNMQQWACYNRAEPDYATFLANPQWWLKDDAGAPVLNNDSPQYDWQNPQGVAHWLAMPLASPLLDGYLLDGGAVYQPEANVSPARAEANKLAKYAAMGRMQQQLTALNGGLVLANGMAGGSIDPHVNDPFNLHALDFANGVENERGTPAFEYVDGTTGAFKKDLIAANLAAVEQASQLANGTKVVA
jgi:hypothetical protein